MILFRAFKYLLFCAFLLVTVSCTSPDPTNGDSSLSASLEPNPVLNGSIENWESGKTGLLKFRSVKKNLVGSALFEISSALGSFDVSGAGGFSAPLPSLTDLEPLLEDAKTTLGGVPCYGSSIQVAPEKVKIALVFLDLFWSADLGTETQLVAANNNQLQHYDFKAAPVGSKYSLYAFAEKDATIGARCSLLVAGSYTVNLNLKQGWNLVTLEIKSRGGLFNATDLRISTDGVPDGLKWFTFGANSNMPTPAPPQTPAPFPTQPVEPRATH